MIELVAVQHPVFRGEESWGAGSKNVLFQLFEHVGAEVLMMVWLGRVRACLHTQVGLDAYDFKAFTSQNANTNEVLPWLVVEFKS